MLKRIDILSIIRDHFKTLKGLDQEDDRISLQDFFLFIMLPSAISFMLVVNHFTFEQQIGNLISAISIFGGFLFNLLAIIYSQIDKIRQDSVSRTINQDPEELLLKQKFVNEIHKNISFCIVLSISIVVTLLLNTVEMPKSKYFHYLEIFIEFVTYFLLGLFLLTLLMVVNRVYILLKKDSQDNNQNNTNASSTTT